MAEIEIRRSSECKQSLDLTQENYSTMSKAGGEGLDEESTLLGSKPKVEMWPILERKGRRVSLLNDDSRHPSGKEPMMYDKVSDQTGGDSERSRKRYPCRFRDSLGCEKSFTTSGHASRHSKIHTLEKTVSCSWPSCYKKFVHIGSMKQHLETHTKDQSRVAPVAPVQSQQHSPSPSGGSHVQIEHPDSYYRPQTPVQYTNQEMQYESHFTPSWSTEQLAQERLRLGLPQYASQEEVEAARLAYNEAQENQRRSSVPRYVNEDDWDIAKRLDLEASLARPSKTTSKISTYGLNSTDSDITLVAHTTNAKNIESSKSEDKYQPSGFSGRQTENDEAREKEGKESEVGSPNDSADGENDLSGISDIVLVEAQDIRGKSDRGSRRS